jgi:hypothetical protein
MLLPLHFETLQYTIQRSLKGKAPGYLADSPDMLIATADRSAPCCSDENGTTWIQHLLLLFLTGSLPLSCCHILRANYLLALYKDYIHKPQNLRPLGIGTALRCLLDRHITKVFAGAMAKHIFPFQFAIGVKGVIDFLLQTYISILPSQVRHWSDQRSIIRIDFENMFNSISRKIVREALSISFPKLLYLYDNLYPQRVNVKSFTEPLITMQYTLSLWKLSPALSRLHQHSATTSLEYLLVARNMSMPPFLPLLLTSLDWPKHSIIT